MSTVTHPIRELLNTDISFIWSKPQEETFNKIKAILSTEPVLAYYDVKKPVTISCDALQSGLGALLMQDDKPVTYASRALTDQKCTCKQKELLAVVFNFNRFHQYVYGKEMKVESDHKPLESITKKSLSVAPPCLQRMLLQLQWYTFNLVYKPGKEVIPVYPEHNNYYVKSSPHNDDLGEDLVCAVNLVIENLPVSDSKLKAIQDATENDTTMTKLKDMRLSQDGQKREQRFLKC